MLRFVFSVALLVALKARYSFALDLLPIAGYIPGSAVEDHAAIDLDQAVLETRLGALDDDGFEAAKKVYSEGGYSKSTATLTLTEAVESTIYKGTRMIGTSVNGEIAQVSVLSDVNSGKVLTVKYLDVLSCSVGGLEEDLRVTIGCLKVEKEKINTITDGTNVYAYEGVVNENGRTLKGFSTAAESKMSFERHAKYFKDYYGRWDYADHWVMSSFDGAQTTFSNFNNNFGSYGMEGNEQCIKKGTAYMNVFIYAIHEFEASINKCIPGVKFQNTEAIHAWDEGVAFYTGSLEGTNGDGSGKLIYALADKRCVNFKTCGDGESHVGTSYVNMELFSLFKKGFDQIQQGDCDGAEDTKDYIADLMYVPLIQGTLKYAYAKQTGTSEKGQAEGAVFAAAVLPRVHAANPDAAVIIAEEMVVGKADADAVKVKEAFESVYDEMGISCHLVGGLINSYTRFYYRGMTPCVETCKDKPDKEVKTTDLTYTCKELSELSDELMYFICDHDLNKKMSCPGVCDGRCACGKERNVSFKKGKTCRIYETKECKGKVKKVCPATCNFC